MTTRTIVFLPGDGIGPEVTAAARRVLETVTRTLGVTVEMSTARVGGAAIDADGTPLPTSTLERCRTADAVFLGAVGGPKWQDAPIGRRPEDGLLGLRAALGVFANLRPVRILPAMLDDAPVDARRVRGTDLVIVRELTGGIYFGARKEQGDGDHASDTMRYSVDEVARVARVAFRLARSRNSHVTSVDKANVLASMRLWRRTVEAVSSEFPDVTLEHMLVDACAMRLITSPTDFDVVLTPNLFGDILSDEASVLAGSLGMLPSASLGAESPGLYEPVHGSAPDIAGRGIANPLGAIASVAMMLRESLDLAEAAETIEQAIADTLESGLRTADMVADGAVRGRFAKTDKMVDAILERLTP